MNPAQTKLEYLLDDLYSKANIMKKKIAPMISGILFVVCDHLISQVFSLLDHYMAWMLMRWIVWPIMFIKIYAICGFPYRWIFFAIGISIGPALMSFITTGQFDLLSILGYLTYSAAFGSIVFVFFVFLLASLLNKRKSR